jgi:hypothetical protein
MTAAIAWFALWLPARLRAHRAIIEGFWQGFASVAEVCRPQMPAFPLTTEEALRQNWERIDAGLRAVGRKGA